MFYIRLKINSQYVENFVMMSNHCIGGLPELKYYKCFWNKNTKKFGANAFIKISQIDKKSFIIRYKINNEVIYKKFEIMAKYKNLKYNIDLDDTCDFCDDIVLQNTMEKLLMNTLI